MDEMVARHYKTLREFKDVTAAKYPASLLSFCPAKGEVC